MRGRIDKGKMSGVVHLTFQESAIENVRDEVVEKREGSHEGNIEVAVGWSTGYHGDTLG